mmetsp:Transcript_34477/g.111283  ORF Transcript_34477/g.111283 Transcript_34477/m.111283 type:complete len:132 (+) Transcript_34477:3-398(+)
MGQGASTASIARYTNDYELVIRASKALEQLLEDEFCAGETPGVARKRPRDDPSLGLHDKISRATTREGEPLPAGLVRQMRYLATIRNRLVHERGFDAIPDRSAFVAAFDNAEGQLRALRPERSNSGGCTIC